ncbi:MAG: cell division protein [Flaviaesturariibacter sp.]|nr:cell division protein [Flaviaesturariibacter sp.]
MPLIQLTTFIKAPIDKVFDLARSIDLHQDSMTAHSEKAIAGRQQGLIEKGETVTWMAKHVGKERKLKVIITAMNKPHSFADEMLEGDFAKMKHEHFFKQCENGTIMIDQFYFSSPYGIVGKLANHFFLTAYMTRLLEKRNQHLKAAAEL